MFIRKQTFPLELRMPLLIDVPCNAEVFSLEESHRANAPGLLTEQHCSADASVGSQVPPLRGASYTPRFIFSSFATGIKNWAPGHL